MSYLGVVASGIVTVSGTTQQTLTVATAVAAGGTIIGSVTWDSADNTVPTVSSIVDSRGNNYATDEQVAGGTTVALVQFRGKISNALEVGDTITITISPAHFRWATKVLGFNDVLQALGDNPLDAHVNNPAVNSTSMYSGQVATTQDRILLVASHGLGINRTFTAPGGWTDTTSVETNAGSADRAVKMLFRYVTTIGTYSETTTISPTGTNVGILCAYKVVEDRENYSRVEHRAEGIAAGTALTTSNTGAAAGVAYSSVSGTVTANATTGIAAGTRSMAHSVSTQATAGGRDSATMGATRITRGRGYFRFTANPSTNMGFIQALNGSSPAVRVQITTTGTARIIDFSGTQMAVSAGTIPLNQVVRAEWRFVASSSAGQASLKIWFTPTSTGTPDISLSSAASFNTLAYFDNYDTGIQFASNQTYSTVYADEVIWTNDDLAEIGPVVDPHTSTWEFDGVNPLDGFDATGNAAVSASYAHTGTGVRLDSRTLSSYLRQSYQDFGKGKRWASIAGWFRQPLGAQTANCAVAKFATDGVLTGDANLWIDKTTGFLNANMFGPKPMVNAGDTTTASSTSATSLAANKPANVQDLDLLWAVFFHKTAGATITAPAGWTIHKSDNAGNATFCFATKPISSAAAETATSYTFSTSGAAARCILHIGRIVGANLSSPLDVAGTTSGYTGTGTLTLPGITTVGKALVLGIASNNTNTSTPSVFTAPPGMIQVTQSSVVSGSTTSDLQVSHIHNETAGGTGNEIATLSPTAANTGGFLVSIKPSSLVGSTNLGSAWFYLQAVCGFKDDGSSFLKMKVNGTEIGKMTSAMFTTGDALDHVVLGLESGIADAVMDVDSVQITVSDSTLDYVGNPTSPGIYVLSGGAWVAATSYTRVGGSWVVTTTPYVRSGGSWVAAS